MFMGTTSKRENNVKKNKGRTNQVEQLNLIRIKECRFFPEGNVDLPMQATLVGCPVVLKYLRQSFNLNNLILKA